MNVSGIVTTVRMLLSRSKSYLRLLMAGLAAASLVDISDNGNDIGAVLGDASSDSCWEVHNYMHTNGHTCAELRNYYTYEYGVKAGKFSHARTLWLLCALGYHLSARNDICVFKQKTALATNRTY